MVDRISSDLQTAFPGTAGFSPRSLRDMKRFYLAYADDSIWRQAVAKLNKVSKGSGIGAQSLAKFGKIKSDLILRQLVAEIPWGHNLLILNKLTDPAARLFYLRCAEKNDVDVEYALRTKANPIGVAVYQLQPKLPGELRGKLPTAKQLAEVVRAELERGR